MSDPAGRGEFPELVSWLVQSTPSRSVSRLARESGVSQRTLQKWLAGEHPRDRLTRTVEQLDDWAVRTVAGYPPPGGTGVRLTELVRRTAAPGAPPEPAPADRWWRRRRAVPLTALVVVLVTAAVTAAVLTEDARGGHPHPALVAESGDNRLGTPVFATTAGAAAPEGVPSRIPYGTRIEVRCYAPNETGVASISALYLVDSGVWHDLWAVADTMTNGGPVGTTTTPDLDPAVRRCAAGEH